MLTILRQRNFMLLWGAGLTSLLGDWVLYTALPFYIYVRTGSALVTGIMFIIQILPDLFLGPIAGVLADRWDRKKILVGCDLARACILLLLLTVPSLGWLWLIYVVGVLETAISTLFTPARGAILPQLVEEKHLLQANSWNNVSDNFGRLVGPILGGALLAFLGLNGVVLVDIVSYLLSALLIVSILVPVRVTEASAPSTQPAEAKASLWQDWLAGLQVLVHERWMIALCVIMGIGMFAQGIINVLLVVFARQVLHSDAQIFGWLVSAQGIGGILGGLLIGHMGKALAPGRLLALSLGSVGILFLMIINIPLLPVVLGLFALLGIPVIGWMVSAQTLLQGRSNKAYLGRVLSAFGTIQIVLMLVGMGLGSLLGNPFGVVPMLDLAGGALLAAGIGAFVLLGNMNSIARPASEHEKSSLLPNAQKVGPESV